MRKEILVFLICALVLGSIYWIATTANVGRTSGARDISGVWQIANYEPTIRPIKGTAIPFTPVGLATYEENARGLQAGTVEDFSETLCLPPGLLRAMNSPDPFEIVVTPDVVAVLVKGFYYLVRMNEGHDADDLQFFPAFMGYHIGHWEGDTLVIDTRGFNPYTWLDTSGVPHGYELRTVQRVRRIGQRQLENVITIEDNEYFEMPWSVRLVYEEHHYTPMATGGHPCDDRGIASRYVHERQFGPPY